MNKNEQGRGLQKSVINWLITINIRTAKSLYKKGIMSFCILHDFIKQRQKSLKIKKYINFGYFYDRN